MPRAKPVQVLTQPKNEIVHNSKESGVPIFTTTM